MQRNAEKAREAMRRWRERHPDAKRAQSRTYYRDHRAEIIAKVAAYQRVHPEIGRTRAIRRRGREVGAQGTYNTGDWVRLLDEFGHRCGYCGTRGRIEADHRVPLFRGGTNYIDNIIPSCVPCNRRKGRMTEEEFREVLRLEAAGEPCEAVSWMATKDPANRCDGPDR